MSSKVILGLDASRAVRLHRTGTETYSLELIKALARLQGVTSRVGLHAGECELIEGEFGGPAVELAAEIMNKARPGQVLVSGTVRDLVMGAGFTFVEHGRYTFNAVPGEWPLFALER